VWLSRTLLTKYSSQTNTHSLNKFKKLFLMDIGSDSIVKKPAQLYHLLTEHMHFSMGVTVSLLCYTSIHWPLMHNLLVHVAIQMKMGFTTKQFAVPQTIAV
jgi:hypothetical protein